jgi:hypothetical protein
MMTEAGSVEAIIEGWRAGIAGLDPTRPPAPGIINVEPGPQGRRDIWSGVHEMMRRFIEERGAEAVALGWSTLSLFGVHRMAGTMRQDATGALITLYPRKVIEMTSTEIKLRRNGVVQTYRGLVNPADSVPAWEFNFQGGGRGR